MKKIRFIQPYVGPQFAKDKEGKETKEIVTGQYNANSTIDIGEKLPIGEALAKQLISLGVAEEVKVI